MKYVLVVLGVAILLVLSACSAPSTGNPSTGATKTAASGTTASTTCSDEPSKCADQNGLQALSEKANPASVCDTMPHDGWKHICLAMVNKDLKGCTQFFDPDTDHQISQTYRAYCRHWVIGVMDKPELCADEGQYWPSDDKQTPVDDCYRVVAVIQKDKTICAKTSDPTYCEHVISAEGGADVLSVCQKGDDPCIIDYAFAHNAKAACDKTGGGVWKVSCLAALSGDHASCKQFTDLDQWYFCDLHASYKQIHPQPGIFDFTACGTIHQCYRTFILQFGQWLVGT